MKKQNTLLVTLLLSVGVSYGQITQISNLPTKKLALNKTKAKGAIKVNISMQKAGGDTLWINDFSTPTDWSMSNTGTPSADWVIGTAAPSGSFSVGMGAINSTSGGNFAMFDSDALGSGSSTQDAVIQVASAIDLSASPNVTIQFESYYRRFQGNCYVETSPDGSTWTQYEVHSNIASNNSTANPELVHVNVSASIGGASAAWIRFRYVGAWDYAWMVDDVALIEPYANDMKINQILSSTGAQGLKYTQIPTTQVAATTITSFSAYAENTGINSEDVTLNVTQGAYNGMGTVATTIPSSMIDSVYIDAANGYTVPSTIGNYPFMYTLTASTMLDNTIDDTASVGFQVTDKIMAVDAFDGNPASIDGEFTGWASPSGDPSIGTYYEIFNNASIERVQVGIYPVSAANQGDYTGNAVHAAIYVYNTGTSTFDFLIATDDYNITASDYGTLINLDFPNAQSLNAGDLIEVVAGFYDGSSIPVAFAGNIPAGQTAGYDGNSAVQLASDDSATVPAPVVRLDFGQYLGVKESSITSSQVSLYPNPANNSATITYSLNTASTVNILVRDLSGRTVYSSTEENQTEGAHNHAISTASLANGIYTYSIQANGNEVTNKFVVQK